MNKKIGVMGCGWLGLPLAEKLLKDGYKVNGTTTSDQKLEILREKGINAFKISISDKSIDGPILKFLKDCSVIIINIPPGLRGKGAKENYVSKIGLLHKALAKSNIKKVLFVSSTSVYGNVTGIVNEKTKPEPSTTSGKQILECEKLFQNDTSLKATILRFAGLIGPNRHPVTVLSGKENLGGGNAPVNLIHLDDCIGIITSIIKNDLWNTILNGVYPAHPTKQEYYTKQALHRGLKPPHYSKENSKNWKNITTSNLFLTKKYRFFTTIN